MLPYHVVFVLSSRGCYGVVLADGLEEQLEVLFQIYERKDRRDFSEPPFHADLNLPQLSVVSVLGVRDVAAPEPTNYCM